MHLNILLELHETTDISQAFQHFSAWINEGVDELIFIKCLTKTVCLLLVLGLGNCYKNLLFPAPWQTLSRGVSLSIQVVYNSKLQTMEILFNFDTVHSQVCRCGNNDNYQK